MIDINNLSKKFGIFATVENLKLTLCNMSMGIFVCEIQVD